MLAPVLPTLAQELASASPVARSSPRIERPGSSAQEAPAIAGCYLLAFYHNGTHCAFPAVRVSHHTGAMHYLGYADNVRERIEAHRAGRGAKLCRAAILAGYELRLVRVWPGRDRAYERSLKDRHNLRGVCPECAFHLAPDTPRAPARRAPRLWIEERPGAQEAQEEEEART